MHSCVVEIQKVFIILSRKVSQCMLKMGLLLVKNARGDNSCLTLSTAHIRIYKVETEVYFCANFLIKSTLPLKPRCCCLKAIQKLFRPNFFWANKISLKSIRKLSILLSAKNAAAINKFLRPLLTIVGIFWVQLFFLTFVGTHLTPYQIDKESKVSMKKSTKL